MMEDFFDNYKKAKMSLCRMVGQFLTCYMCIDKAKELNLNTDNEYFVINNYVEVCTHGNSLEGNKAWKFLGLNREFVSHDDIWKLENDIYYENRIVDMDYSKLYSEIVILLIELVIKYYSRKLSIEDANRFKIDYNANSDVINGHIWICDNLCESAGESVWALLNIEKDYVPITKLNEIKNQFIESLESSHNKQRILKKKGVDPNE